MRHEPHDALFAGADGLSAIRRLAAQLAVRRDVRFAALEVGAGQAPAVAGLLRDSGFPSVRRERDLAGIERVVVAERRWLASDARMSPTLTGEDALRLQECVAAGGVAVFPSDTVYGVCCDPDNHDAARRMYELKGRPAARSCAVMFFQLSSALEHLEGLTEPERLALGVLLPGPLTLLLANRSMSFAAACRNDPSTLGLRVPRLPESLAALERVERPVMQSSANLSGEPDARSLQEIPAEPARGSRPGARRGRAPGPPLDRRGPPRLRPGAPLARAPRRRPAARLGAGEARPAGGLERLKPGRA